MAILMAFVLPLPCDVDCKTTRKNQSPINDESKERFEACDLNGDDNLDLNSDRELLTVAFIRFEEFKSFDRGLQNLKINLTNVSTRLIKNDKVTKLGLYFD